LDSITGQFKPIVLLPPTVIQDHSKGMKGTDMIDQRYRYYRFGYRATKRQYMLLFHFYLVAVVNSYILWKESRSDERNNVNQMTFMTSLMKELAKCVNKAEKQADVRPILCQALDNLGKISGTWLPDNARLYVDHIFLPGNLHMILG